MKYVSKIQVPVAAATAAALADPRRLVAIGHLIDRLVQPGGSGRLAALLEQTAAEAEASGLTEAEIEAELAAYDAERRADV